MIRRQMQFGSLRMIFWLNFWWLRPPRLVNYYQTKLIWEFLFFFVISFFALAQVPSLVTVRIQIFRVDLKFSGQANGKLVKKWTGNSTKWFRAELVWNSDRYKPNRILCTCLVIRWLNLPSRDIQHNSSSTLHEVNRVTWPDYCMRSVNHHFIKCKIMNMW